MARHLLYLNPDASSFLEEAPPHSLAFPFSKNPPPTNEKGIAKRGERAGTPRVLPRRCGIHSSSGFASKYIRTLSNTYRQKSKSHFEAETGSRRRGDQKAFPPPNPESKRVFHAPRGFSFANTIL